MKSHLHLFQFLFFFVPIVLYSQPSDLPWEPDPDCNSIVTSGIVAVSCGVLETLPVNMRFTIGLIDLNGALPASGRIDVTAQQAAYHHPSWHIDSIGNIFGLTIDHCGNVYAAASSNYASVFFFTPSLLRYGELGGGANDLAAAGTIYKIDAQTAQASPWVVLPQQAYSFEHHDCEGFQTFSRTTGPGLGNLTFNHDTRNFYVSNFEDGRIYRIDTLGTIVETYDPFDLDNGNPGPPDLIETPYALTVKNDGTELFFGTMGTGDFAGNPAGVYSIPLNPDGSFVGTVDNSSMPAGATWDNLVGSETFHASVDYFGTCYISGMEFTPDDRLLVGQRIGCNNVIQGSYNHQGKTHLFSDNGSGLYSVLDGIIVSSAGVFAPTNAYGGVSYFELPGGEVQYVMSNGDMLSEQGPHGIVVSPENVFGSFGSPASPQGVIAYNDPSVTDDPKGIGGDVFVFKRCSCEPICPQDLLTEPLAVCSNEPFSLNFAVSNGNVLPSAVSTFEDGTPVPDPDNVSIDHADCAPGVYTFYLNATCEADLVTEYLDTLEVTVVTDDLSPFFTTIEEDCFIDLVIDPDCAAYIELIGTIPDIMIGDSGSVSLELMQTTEPFCAQQTVTLEYNCQCGFEDFSFVQESCDLGEYYITIDFRPEGAGTVFSLSDQTGADFGTYTYAELPLQIGPFVGDDTTAYTLFVQDDDLTECTAFFSFGPLYCPPGQAEWLATSPSCLIESGTLEAVNVIGGAAPYQYSIDGGLTFSSDPVFTGLDPGTYNLVI
ncbi:MAG: hypothetical protein KDC44_09205, partial [Phaeodactylibacter sp.]|nr:hypothetical protein [Phaeodactylibacter sp.]